ncbi:tRNA modification GTPase TrmE [Rhizopus microsporus var. microsporus]|uniref:tRNA modification GTPase TrmE n=1 Tax=Rhizopus microsporus var. microsporus TaxID=86635 RepID=A0A1X0RF67_RHIZD|nr:tRNA modification GTPase TrmE [Rhizopus microsporus var. microsporus]
MTTSPVEPRMANFRRIRHPKTGQVLDRGLILWFPGPRSFTGEDSVELQIHGGNAVVKSVLEALREIEDFRMAEQGEFARRAFDNNKLDLTELEGLADLLNAETELQRKLALQQAEGGLRVPYEKWRQEIIHCMAKTEAVIDFGEDENIEEGVMDEDDSHIGEIVRSGIHVAIMGPPNAGKSTLLNRLTKREAAIVSNIPGTTRDIVEVKLDLAGFPVVLCDTAGLRESSDVIEMEGIKRAKARIDISDIKICMLSAEQGESIDPMVEQLIDDNTYVILNKEDAVSQQELVDLSDRIRAKVKSKNIWTMSCKTGLGVDRFLAELLNVLKSRY